MSKTIFVCSDCGYESAKWYGACPACKQYNTFFEQKLEPEKSVNNVNAKLVVQKSKPVLLKDVEYSTNLKVKSKISEFDRVIGDGFVMGSFTLLGGQPGIGKSTLLLQVVDALASNGQILYTSGEESLSQIKLRAKRLNIKHADTILMQSNNNLNEIINTALEHKVKYLIVDSIQTTYLDEVNSLQGTPGQVKACTLELMKFAKVNNITTIIIGHVTKEGDIAGPKQLEHMVDTVLYMEESQQDNYRVLRSSKNRFGPTDEIGLFKMAESGLVEVNDASSLNTFTHDTTIGVAKSGVLEGNRLMFCELQALVNQTPFGYPKRVALGFELQRLNILIVMIEKQTNMEFTDTDVFAKLVGELKTTSSNIDLAVIMALVSAKINIPLNQDVIFLAEVSLTGELLPLANAELMIKEASKLGFKQIYVSSKIKTENNKVIKCRNLNDVLNYQFKGRK